MRGAVAVAALAAFAWGSAAWAQQDALPEDGVGPYHFGMSVAASQATAPQATWQVADLPNGMKALSGGPRLVLGGARFSNTMVFESDAMRSIVLEGGAQARCGDVMPGLVDALSDTFGVFDGVAGPNEQQTLRNTTQTPGGSTLRSRSAPGGASLYYSTRRSSGMSVQVMGTPRSDMCIVSVSLSGVAARTPIGNPEFDNAQEIYNPNFTAEPTMQSYMRVMRDITPEVRARAREQAGDQAASSEVQLDCLVNADATLRCVVAQETPAGLGLGDAAISVAQDYRITQDTSGNSAVGKRVRVSIPFNFSRGGGGGRGGR